jgi:hypothetical protein
VLKFPPTSERRSAVTGEEAFAVTVCKRKDKCKGGPITDDVYFLGYQGQNIEHCGLCAREVFRPGVMSDLNSALVLIHTFSSFVNLSRLGDVWDEKDEKTGRAKRRARGWAGGVISGLQRLQLWHTVSSARALAGETPYLVARDLLLGVVERMLPKAGHQYQIKVERQLAHAKTKLDEATAARETVRSHLDQKKLVPTEPRRKFFNSAWGAYHNLKSVVMGLEPSFRSGNRRKLLEPNDVLLLDMLRKGIDEPEVKPELDETPAAETAPEQPEAEAVEEPVAAEAETPVAEPVAAEEAAEAPPTAEDRPEEAVAPPGEAEPDTPPTILVGPEVSPPAAGRPTVAGRPTRRRTKGPKRTKPGEVEDEKRPKPKRGNGRRRKRTDVEAGGDTDGELAEPPRRTRRKRPPKGEADADTIRERSRDRESSGPAGWQQRLGEAAGNGELTLRETEGEEGSE